MWEIDNRNIKLNLGKTNKLFDKKNMWKKRKDKRGAR